MTRTKPFRRGAILRTVLETADQRRDGRLPTDVPGVGACFRDDLDLTAALSLRWHARLTTEIGSELAARTGAGPGADRPDAVVRAWARAATGATGLRLLLDECLRNPTSHEMALAMATAERREWIRLANAAGLDGADAGLQLARRARRVTFGPDAEAPVPLDECLRNPTSHEMALAMATAERREWIRLANAAGLDGADAGLQLARRARRVTFGPDAEAPVPVVVPSQRRPVEGGRHADMDSLTPVSVHELESDPLPQGEPAPRAPSTPTAGNGQTVSQTAMRTAPRTPSLVARIRSALAA